MIWFGWVLWHINHCTLFYDKSSLDVYTKYDFVELDFMTYQPLWVIWYQILFRSMYKMWFGLVWFGFIAYQPLWVIWCQILFILMHWIYVIWFDCVLWHIKHCSLFNAKSSLHIYSSGHKLRKGTTTNI